MDEMDIPDFLQRKGKIWPIATSLPEMKSKAAEIPLPENIEVNRKEIIAKGMRENASRYITEINGFFDDVVFLGKDVDFSPYEYFRVNEIKGRHIDLIIEFFSPQLKEIEIRNSDPQLKEAYRGYKSTEIRTIIMFFSTLIDDATRWCDSQSAAKGPRKKRRVIIKPEKKVKSIKYQREDRELKLLSIPPEKIIGAQELWTYNTKYKHLTRYVARTRTGLSMKGTTLQDFDVDNSCTKVLRKPDEILGEVLKSGKRKILDNLKTKSIIPTGRINDKTILLRAL